MGQIMHVLRLFVLVIAMGWTSIQAQPNNSRLSPRMHFYNEPTGRHVIVSGNMGSAVQRIFTIIGDFNGDGYNDILIGCPSANSDIGLAFVVYGDFPYDIDIPTFSTSLATGLRIHGASPSFGTNALAAGDLNGDDFADILVAGTGTSDIYAIFGSSIHDIDIFVADLWPPLGFKIYGFPTDWEVRVFATAGDMNGDNLSDIVLGLPMANRDGVEHCGMVVVLFSRQEAHDIDIAAAVSSASLEGIRIYGALANDQIGSVVASGGDINNDGFADLLIGASGSKSNNNNGNSGVYVVFGTGGALDCALTEKADANRGFKVYSSSDNSWMMGQSMSFVGDVNGDGVQDFALSVHQVTSLVNDDHGRTGAIEGHMVAVVIYGVDSLDPTASSTARDLRLDAISPGRGFAVCGSETHDRNLPVSVVPAGDVNGDGLADVLFGMPAPPGPRSHLAGSVFLLYGTAARRSVVELQSLESESTIGCTIVGRQLISGNQGWNRHGTPQLLLLESAKLQGDKVYLVSSTNICLPIENASLAWSVSLPQSDVSTSTNSSSISPGSNHSACTRSAAAQVPTITSVHATRTGVPRNASDASVVLAHSRSSVHVLNLNPTMTPTQLPTNNRCPGGTMYSNRCFYQAGNTMSWTSCQTHCSSQGWRMLCVDDATTNAFIKNTLTSFPSVWLGLNDLVTENSFAWSSSCTPDTYRSWNAANGEPNNAGGNEDCVALPIASGLWNDGPCTGLRGCGCESTWTAAPTIVPTAFPTTSPTFTPTAPTASPTANPTFIPTAAPSEQPTLQPSFQPTSRPSAQPTRQPTQTPSVQPSTQPSSAPSAQPSRQPSPQPSRQPVSPPTTQPTVQPSSQPSGQPGTQPSNQPSSQPFSQPSAQPSGQPSSQPSEQPSTQPSRQPTCQPSAHPSTGPTSQPSRQPSAQPSAQPSRQPSAKPTRQPTSQPSHQPSIAPSSQPSRQPSVQPSVEPSAQPSNKPSIQPSMQPFGLPSLQPSGEPTNQPSSRPSLQPSTQPTDKPTDEPSGQPSVGPTSQPTIQPSAQPSTKPTDQPTIQPSGQPSAEPSSQPSSQPSIQPSMQPSRQPSSQPSTQPSVQPNGEPTSPPSSRPSMQPSTQPTDQPTDQPNCQPSGGPSSQPTMRPSFQPSAQPSLQPSAQPTTQPRAWPSAQPSSLPSSQPSVQPSDQPSAQPSSKPSAQPSMQPSSKPSRQPSHQPSHQPSLQPRAVPTSQPTYAPSERPNSEWTIIFPHDDFSFATLAVHGESVWACGDKGHCILVDSVNGELLSEFSLNDDVFSVLSIAATDKVVISSTTDSSSEVKHCSVILTHLTCDATLFMDSLYKSMTFVSLSNKLVLLGHYGENLIATTMTLPDFTTESYSYSISNTKSVVMSQIISPPNFVGSFIAGTGVRSAGLPVNYVIFGKLRSDYGTLTTVSLAPASGNILNSAELVNAMALEYVNLDLFIAGGLHLNDGNGIHAYLMRVNGLFNNIFYCVRYHINVGSKIALADTSDLSKSVTRGIVLVEDSLFSLVEVTSVGASATTTTHIALLQINAATGAIVKEVNIAARNGSFTCSNIVSTGSNLMVSCALNHGLSETRGNILISTNLELSFTKLPAELVLLDDSEISAEYIPFVQRALLVTTKTVEISTSQYAYTSVNKAPSRMPSVSPTLDPSQHSSDLHSKKPSSSPSISPQPTSQPSSSGPTNTYKPTVQPSLPRSTAPSLEPTMILSVPPTIIPTAQPTASPSLRPSVSSTVAPTTAPTRTPSAKPTRLPTKRPTIMPTRVPSVTSTRKPTVITSEAVGDTVQSGVKMSKLITIIVSCVGGVCTLIWMIYYMQLLLRYGIKLVEKDKRRLMFVKASGEVVNLQYPILHALFQYSLKEEPLRVVADKGKHENNVNGEGEDSAHTSYGRGANIDSFVDLEANIPDAKIPQVLTTHSSTNKNDERRAGLLANMRTDAESGESDDSEREESDSDMILFEESSQSSEYASSVCSKSSNRDVASDASYNSINSDSSYAQSHRSGDSAECESNRSGSKYSEIPGIVESDAELRIDQENSDASAYDNSNRSLSSKRNDESDAYAEYDEYDEYDHDTYNYNHDYLNDYNNSFPDGSAEETDPNDVDGYDDIGARDCNYSSYNFESDSGSNKHSVYNDGSVREHDANNFSGESSKNNGGSVASGTGTVDSDFYYLW